MPHVDKDLFAAAQAGDRAALERLLSQLIERGAENFAPSARKEAP